MSPQRAPTPQGCPASHTPAGVFAGGGGDAYSPQDLPLPPLRPRARARSETRSDEKRYFPAQSRRARLGWRWSPGHAELAAGQPAAPRRLPPPRHSPARPSRGMALLCQAEARGKSDLHRGLFNGASTTPGPTRQNRFTAAFLPVTLDFFSKQPPKPARSQDPKVASAPRSRRPSWAGRKALARPWWRLGPAGHQGAAGWDTATPMPQMRTAGALGAAPPPCRHQQGPVTHSRETPRRGRSTPRNTSWCRRRSLSLRRHLSLKTLKSNKET